MLFVDDEPLFLAGILRQLHRHRNKWQPHIAQSANEALELVQKENFDVILSDVNMPGRSGFDLLKDLQSDVATRSIPVIIITGSGEADIKKKALKEGATDLLSKPVDYGDLVARISNALRLKSYQDEIIAHNVTLENKVQERTAELEFLHQDIIWRLAKVGEMRDEETGDHVIRVAHYSQLIARAVALNSEEIKRIFFTAPLHDLGKIGTPDGILLKKGKLDDFEWSIMTQHCAAGAAILLEQPKGMELIDMNRQVIPDAWVANDILRQTAATIALTHHEKWDGSGYPRGLSETDIPLPGRIVAFADVYDALRSKRPYKKVYDMKKTWSIIENGVGSHFDPDIFEKIKDSQDEFERIRELHLD